MAVLPSDTNAGGEPEAEKPAPQRSAEAPQLFLVPVIGWGSVAPSPEMMTQALRGLPAAPGLAFILAPRLDGAHAAEFAELLNHFH